MSSFNQIPGLPISNSREVRRDKGGVPIFTRIFVGVNIYWFVPDQNKDDKDLQFGTPTPLNDI